MSLTKYKDECLQNTKTSVRDPFKLNNYQFDKHKMKPQSQPSLVGDIQPQQSLILHGER